MHRGKRKRVCTRGRVLCSLREGAHTRAAALRDAADPLRQLVGKVDLTPKR